MGAREHGQFREGGRTAGGSEMVGSSLSRPIGLGMWQREAVIEWKEKSLLPGKSGHRSLRNHRHARTYTHTHQPHVHTNPKTNKPKKQLPILIELDVFP